MAGEPQVCVIGNVAGDPELRFSPGGVAVLNFTVASTPRNKNKDTGSYEDGETLWVRCTAFRNDAENGAESLSKGTRVIVWGRLSQESWETKEGEKRTSLKLVVEEMGASTKWAQVTVRKAGRSSDAPKREAAPAHDPWATSPADEEPPF